ncbi:myosin-binding protein 3 [Salvia hispanica]|uniref:myosin-binding protein 3 n=1 Tax=Salvia hispanica TaxID=49212 RepID=UPI002008F4E2|nr:myosin-binding protein 3 [Salvia hispanica]
MAANKFATMLHKNCPKIIVILVYAFLEWILILLLLLNSLFSHLIAKFVEFAGLKPSCPWCSTLDHHFDHVCEAHGTEIGKMTFCAAHNKLATDSHSLCIRCSSSTGATNDVSSTVAFFTWRSENAGGEEARCSCCDDQILTTHQSIPFKPTWDLLLEYVHKHKLGYEVKKETEFRENGGDDGEGFDQKKIEDGKKAEDLNVEVEEWDSSHTVDEPFSQGRNEDEESEYIEDMLLQNAELMDSDRFICIELIDTDTDAAAAPTPTNSSEDVEDNDTKIDGEALAHEIGLIESNNIEELNRNESHTIEALYAELEEEREAAAEAARESMAMITKLQEEKAAMQMEAVQYQRMMEEQAEYDQEALQLLNDLITKRDKENRQLHEELQMYKLTPTTSPYKTRMTHSVDSEHEIGDVSLAEFDEERASILEQVKVLCDDGDQPMAKKLLPLFDGAEDDQEEMVLMEEEVEHVYERLQALEADSDFLKHCIRSMSKGNEGMALLQEIMQHLRDLKSVQTNLL